MAGWPSLSSEAPRATRLKGDPARHVHEDAVGCPVAGIGQVRAEDELDVGQPIHAEDPPTALARASASMAARMARCA